MVQYLLLCSISVNDDYCAQQVIDELIVDQYFIYLISNLQYNNK